MIFSSYKKHTSSIVLLVLLLAMVGIVWYGVMPLKQGVYEKMRGIQEFYARKENREKQVARLPELKIQYDAAVENEKLLNILIPENKLVDFVKTLEGLAGENNVEMSITSKDNGEIVEPKKVVSKAAPATKASDEDAAPTAKNTAKQKPVDILDDIAFDRYLYLSVKARGQYKDIVAFLRKMETLPVGLDVVGVEMTEGVSEDKPARVTSESSANPFFVSGSNTQPVVSDTSVVKKSIFEATFSVVVYVDKQD